MDRKVLPVFAEVDASEARRFLPGVRAYVYEGENGALCRAMVSKDAGRWHLSVSVEDRYPTWEEIKAARYGLIPDDVFMVMSLPPEEHYINLHPNAFQLWETSDRGLVCLNKHEMPPEDDEYLRRSRQDERDEKKRGKKKRKLRLRKPKR